MNCPICNTQMSLTERSDDKTKDKPPKLNYISFENWCQECKIDVITRIWNWDD